MMYNSIDDWYNERRVNELKRIRNEIHISDLDHGMSRYLLDLINSLWRDNVDNPETAMVAFKHILKSTVQELTELQKKI